MPHAKIRAIRPQDTFPNLWVEKTISSYNFYHGNRMHGILSSREAPRLDPKFTEAEFEYPNILSAITTAKLIYPITLE